jgi:hypothetical protein
MANQVTVHQGTRIQMTVLTTNAAGTATDPDSATFQLQEPDGTETTYTVSDGEVANTATGTWVFSYVTQAAGEHTVRFVGSGTVDVADERSFEVLPSVFTSP